MFWFFEPVEELGGQMAARKRGTNMGHRNTCRLIRSLGDSALCLVRTPGSRELIYLEYYSGKVRDDAADSLVDGAVLQKDGKSNDKAALFP